MPDWPASMARILLLMVACLHPTSLRGWFVGAHPMRPRPWVVLTEKPADPAGPASFVWTCGLYLVSAERSGLLAYASAALSLVTMTG